MDCKSIFLFDVLKRYDHYIGTTNFKVGLMMSFLLTVVLGLTLRVVVLGSKSDINIIMFSILILFVFLTITLSLVAVYKLLCVVFPNTKNPSFYESMIFFGDVSTTHGGAAGYHEKIKTSSEEEILKDLSFQTFTVAGIVSDKFKTLQVAVNIIRFCVVPLLFISIIFILIIH
ncbi:Pycsar system effector family protein [uncultured Desulfuromonas sp.]|uniref:Pycsar system effector family protein n=1 Tax=uncultured Desulfuromonas sp. TaxID=181013 RepID=UPI002AAA8BEF|nr:Pycsar system effector family protein [uncultured Desulfuromonas sp.]